MCMKVAREIWFILYRTTLAQLGDIWGSITCCHSFSLEFRYPVEKNKFFLLCNRTTSFWFWTGEKPVTLISEGQRDTFGIVNKSTGRTGPTSTSKFAKVALKVKSDVIMQNKQQINLFFQFCVPLVNFTKIMAVNSKTLPPVVGRGKVNPEKVIKRVRSCEFC